MCEEDLDGDVVVLEPATGLLHVLTGTGASAWKLLRGGRTRAVVLAEVTALYGVSGDAVAVAELTAFLDDLVHRGLVVDGA